MDLKQLQYFVVCAQTGSFSDAAKNLYSTQPSVSKVIKGLEDTLGMQLFERLPRGIRLTVQGKKVYQYASKIINDVDVLENMASRGMTKWIRISMNPSSWFANQFVDFYNETYEKNYHFSIHGKKYGRRTNQRIWYDSHLISVFNLHFYLFSYLLIRHLAAECLNPHLILLRIRCQFFICTVIDLLF